MYCFTSTITYDWAMIWGQQLPDTDRALPHWCSEHIQHSNKCFWTMRPITWARWWPLGKTPMWICLYEQSHVSFAIVAFPLTQKSLCLLISVRPLWPFGKEKAKYQKTITGQTNCNITEPKPKEQQSSYKCCACLIPFSSTVPSVYKFKLYYT